MKNETNVEQLRKKVEELQQQLEHAAKLAEMGRLLAVVAHEISQPLLGIKAFAQILLRHYENDEFAAPKLKLIEEQARFMEGLLETLREFSRPSDKNLQSSDPVAAAESVVQLLSDRARKLHIQMEIFPPHRPLKVAMGRGQMQQIIMNLLTNAMDATEPLGKGKIRIIFEPNEDKLRMLVADSGSGVPQEVKHKLFDYFFTTKPVGRGTGLGLPICRQLAENVGGSIRLLESYETKRIAGEEFVTGFEVILPLAKEGLDSSGYSS